MTPLKLLKNHNLTFISKSQVARQWFIFYESLKHCCPGHCDPRDCSKYTSPWVIWINSAHKWMSHLKQVEVWIHKWYSLLSRFTEMKIFTLKKLYLLYTVFTNEHVPKLTTSGDIFVPKFWLTSLKHESETSSVFCSTLVMLGIYISIFIILANILFICAIYSCVKVSSCTYLKGYSTFFGNRLILPLPQS